MRDRARRARDQSRRGETLQCSFGSSRLAAELRIAVHPSYFLVELVKIRGSNVQEVQMAGLAANISAHVDDLLNVQWNDQFAVCVMGLSDRVHAVNGTAVVYPEFRPAPANYGFKQAGRSFNFRSIMALNFRWMRWPKDRPVRCRVSLVEALAEAETLIRGPQIAVAGARITIPAELKTGDYAEYWGEGPVRIFSANGVKLQTVDPVGKRPQIAAGSNRIELSGNSAGPMKLTLIMLGEPLTW